MSFLSRIFKRKKPPIKHPGVFHVQMEVKRKFDSAIQKNRRPIKDPEKFNNLLREFAQQFGKYKIDLRNKKINTSAINSALKIAEKLTKMEPLRAVPWTNKSLALSALERYPEALEANCRALEIDPSDPDKWEMQANILITIGKSKEAETALKRAIQLKQ